MAEPQPIAEQLSSPSGVPLNALTWAEVRTRPAENETYLLATSGQDGQPRVVPVLGVWLEGRMCFNTSRQARKARALAHNGNCVVAVAGDDVDLTLEGTAHPVRDPALLRRVADPYPAKYEWWHPFVRDGEFYDPADTDLSDPRQVFSVEPMTVFAFGKAKGFTATRRRF